ncbi:hypothetical protein L218DRAFT_1004927 [Marasmius fiardii PR-910]|nr:hypothetical protein L218DRAFT_1004927 [Marasmius fiardii PR-910]
MRANLIPLLISTRNSLAIIAHLLVAGRVQYALVSGDEHSQQLLEQAFDILRSNGDKLLKVAPMLLFGELYVCVKDETPPTHPPARGRISEMWRFTYNLPVSKFPKLIPQCYRKLLENAIVPYYGGKDFSTTVISLHSLPMLYGLTLAFLVAMAGCGIVTTCFEPQFPPTIITPSSVLEASEQMKCDIIMTFPSFIEVCFSHAFSALHGSPKYLELTRILTLKGMVSSTREAPLAEEERWSFGCPLGKEIGDKVVSEGISVITEYGAVDTGTLSTWFPKSSPGEDWEYFRFKDSDQNLSHP